MRHSPPCRWLRGLLARLAPGQGARGAREGGGRKVRSEGAGRAGVGRGLWSETAARHHRCSSGPALPGAVVSGQGVKSPSARGGGGRERWRGRPSEVSSCSGAGRAGG